MSFYGSLVNNTKYNYIHIKIYLINRFYFILFYLFDFIFYFTIVFYCTFFKHIYMSSLSFSGSLVISSHLSVFLHLVFGVNPLVISDTGVSVSVAEETEPLLRWNLSCWSGALQHTASSSLWCAAWDAVSLEGCGVSFWEHVSSTSSSTLLISFSFSLFPI